MLTQIPRRIETLETEGPVLVFGGPYSNLEATQALLARASELDIPPERIICTGDVVAYCADPVATVAAVRESGMHVVLGNCEESLAYGAADCGCGFTPGSACDRLSSAWFAHADRLLDASARKWMGSLPARIDLALAGRRIAVVHGGVDVINHFIFPSTRAKEKLRELDSAGADGVIGGHCGLPFTQVIDGRLWHNAGAIGLPAHDGTPRAWFSVLAPKDGGIAIMHHALDYDHAAAARKMREAGLPDGYAAALETGLWPSCDVLPALEIRAAGRALVPGTILWPKQESVSRRGRATEMTQLWPTAPAETMSPNKFRDPVRTADGSPRASVPLTALETLWFNTGTLCNLTCRNCYIESSPRNDQLVYLSLADVTGYLDEIAREGFATREIGFTGGEPFMNPQIIAILEATLTRGFQALVLTNAMRPMARHKEALLGLHARFGDRLRIRVSLDHYTKTRHEEERGEHSYEPTLAGLVWLSQNGFNADVAGRSMWHEDMEAARAGYARLFAAHDIAIDADDPARLVVFPEMHPQADPPEITEACWSILGKSPSEIMCASSRMVVKRKGAEKPVVVSCTLIAYDQRFEMGHTLREATRPVPLNHRNCATFCVLGGASCSVKPKADAAPSAPARDRDVVAA